MKSSGTAVHPQRDRTLWLCMMLHAFTHLYHVALLPLYLMIRRDFGLRSDAEATLLVTVLGAAYYLPSYPMGILADRFNRKRLLSWGLLANGLGFICLGLAPTYKWALASMVLAGLGGSVFHPSATALVAQLFPERPGKALGKVAIGASVGFFFTPIYAGWRAQHAGWRTAVIELGAFGMAGAILFSVLAIDHQRERIKRKPTPINLPASALFMLVAAAFAFAFRDFAGNGMSTLSSLYLQHDFSYSPAQTGWALSWIYAVSAISNPLFGRLSDGHRWRYSLVTLVGGAVFIFIFPWLSRDWLVLGLVGYGFFMLANYPLIEAAIMESVDDSVRGRIFGMFITVGGLIGNIAHWVAGSWSANWRPGPAFRTLAGLVICSTTGLLLLSRFRDRARGKANA